MIQNTYFNLAISKTGTVGKLLSISGKVNILNKVDGIPNVCCTKIAEELDISMRKGIDRILGHSGRRENV
jgi:hypothetical protein